MRALLAGLIFAACSAPVQAGAVRAVDATGTAVALAQPAKRIVSLAPHLTELLFAVGAGPQIVGADEYSDHPPPARAIPRIGRAGALDVERIVALKPELVLAWGSGNTAGQVAQLRRFGLIVYVSEPRTLADVPKNLRDLGELSGRAEFGQRAAVAFERGLDELRKTYDGREPIDVFYQIWHEPLMTVNRDHSISAVIRLCGGRNVFDELSTLAPTVNREAVLRADPQLIIGSGSDATRPQWLDDWRRWPQLQAVKAQALVDIPPDLMQRPTPRMLDGARRVCQAIDEVRQRRQEKRLGDTAVPPASTQAGK